MEEHLKKLKNTWLYLQQKIEQLNKKFEIQNYEIKLLSEEAKKLSGVKCSALVVYPLDVEDESQAESTPEFVDGCAQMSVVLKNLLIVKDARKLLEIATEKQTAIINELRKELERANYNVSKRIIILEDIQIQPPNPVADLNNSDQNVPTAQQQSPVILTKELAAIGWNDNNLWKQGAGLVNIGLTCFVSAILQALFNIPSLIRWLLLYTAHCHENNCLMCEMTEILQSVRQGNVTNPEAFILNFRQRINKNDLNKKDVLLFPELMQQDSHEFLLALQAIMDKDFKQSSPFPAIFEFCLKTKILYECGHDTETLALETALQIPLNNDASLGTLLEQYFMEETLEVACEICIQKSNGRRKPHMHQPPAFLTIVLLRFIFQNKRSTKNECKVDIPQILNVASIDPPTKNVYELTAVVKHIGTSLNSGHYTTLIKTPSNSWIEYDDSTMNLLSFNFEDINRTEPYILFYRLSTTTISIANPVVTSVPATFIRIDDSKPDEKPTMPRPTEFQIGDASTKPIVNKMHLYDQSTMSNLAIEATQLSVGDISQATQLLPNVLATHISSTESSNRPKRQIAAQCYKYGNDESDEDFSPDEEEYHPTDVFSSSSDTDNDCNDFSSNDMDENDDPYEVQRNSLTRLQDYRSTPLNTKRRIRSGQVDEIMADLKVTDLRHKATTFRAAINSTTTEPHDNDRKLRPDSKFTIHQELQINEWIQDERNGRNIMKPGGRQRICELIEQEFAIILTLQQLSDWINNHLSKDAEVKKNPRDYLTEKHWKSIANLRKEFPKDGPTATARKFMAAFPNVQMKQNSISTAIGKFIQDKIDGPFTEIKISLLVQQFEEHGMNWSKYQIPGRSPTSIRQRYAKLIRATIRKIKGKSMQAMLLDAVDELGEDSELTTRDNWLEKTIAMNKTISAVIIRSTFNYALARLIESGKVQRVPPNHYRRRYAEPRQTLPKIKYPRQPLREPLNEEEEEHVRQLINECRKSMKNSKLQWHGNADLTLIATTTHSPDRRELNFQETENSFDDDDHRRIFAQLLQGSDEDSDENEDEDDTDDDIENIQEEVTDNYLSECLKRGLRIVGALRFKKSGKEPKESEEILLFYTHKKNIFEYIDSQLRDLKTRISCPSWLAAIVTKRLSIDWNNISFLTLAEGNKAAMRLKLTTVALLGTRHFNVRETRFTPIENGRMQYFELLRTHAINISNEAYEEMLANIANNLTNGSSVKFGLGREKSGQ